MSVTLRIALTSFPSSVFSSPSHLNSIEYLLRHQRLMVILDDLLLPAHGELCFDSTNTEVEIVVQRVSDQIAGYFPVNAAIAVSFQFS